MFTYYFFKVHFNTNPPIYTKVSQVVFLSGFPNKEHNFDLLYYECFTASEFRFNFTITLSLRTSVNYVSCNKLNGLRKYCRNSRHVCKGCGPRESLPHTLYTWRCRTCRLCKRDTVMGHVVTTADTVACHGSKWIPTASKVKLTLPEKRLLDIPLA
jgi:hypothetical protein